RAPHRSAIDGERIYAGCPPATDERRKSPVLLCFWLQSASGCAFPFFPRSSLLHSPIRFLITIKFPTDAKLDPGEPHYVPWIYSQVRDAFMDGFIARANIDHFLDLLKDGDLAPERRATIVRLLIEEEDKLGHDLEQLDFAESRAENGRRRLQQLR